MIVYNVTGKDGRSVEGSQWDIGVSVEAKGKGDEFGSNNFVACFSDPLVALFGSAAHFQSPRLWKAETERVWNRENKGWELGCKRLMVLEELPDPGITLEQRVKFGILCTLEVYQEPRFVVWAKAWLLGKDHTWRSPDNASALLVYGITTPPKEFAGSSLNAADFALYAANLAAKAAIDLAGTTLSVHTHADEVKYAEYCFGAAQCACIAAWAANWASGHLDLVALAHKALE